MPLFAGVVWRRPLPPEERAARESALAAALVPEPGVPRRRWSGADHAACAVDMIDGAVAEAAPGGAWCVVSGRPLRDPSGDAGPDADAFAGAADAELDRLLLESPGTFAALRAGADGGLDVLGDRLGVRPVYVAEHPDAFVVATSLRALERLAWLPKRLDPRGAVEQVTLGFGLGRRTPYAGVSRLHAAERLRVRADGVHAVRWWRWDDTGIADEDEPTAARQLHAAFAQAITRRAAGASRHVAFLSGGLDSRVIVASLAGRSEPLRTVTFAWQGMLDEVLASTFARAMDVPHEWVPMPPTAFPSFGHLLAAQLRRWALHPADGARGVRCWSGDGGSVGAGHVYVTTIAPAIRAGGADAGIDALLEKLGASVVTGVLGPAFDADARAAPRLGMRDELAGISHPDPVRAMHIFLLLNDQRRHLDRFHEEQEEHGLTFELPFFDADLLTLLVRQPIERVLGHHLYLRWLPLLPSPVTAVPWQSYPGHEPCPLPMPPGARAQWSDHLTHRERLRRRARALRDFARVLRTRPFPSSVLDRGYLLRAAAAEALGLADLGYASTAASRYLAFARACER